MDGHSPAVFDSSPLDIDPRELENSHSVRVDDSSLRSTALEQGEEESAEGEDDGRGLELIKLEDVELGGSRLTLGAERFSSTSPHPRDLHEHIKALASNTVDIDLEKLRLGRAVVECIHHVDKLAQLHFKKAEIIAAANNEVGGSFYGKLDLSDRIDLTRTTRLLSAERGLYVLAGEAMRRCGERWSMEHIMKIGESFSRGPGFLDPLVQDIWASPAA